MKQTYTLFILLVLSYCGFSQTSDFTLTFEDTAVINQVYYTDSILDPAGIWQIGKPNKPFFDSAYASTNAVVTVLDSLLPPASNASFVLSIPYFGIISNYGGGGGMLTFSSWIDLDSAHGGSSVEFSIDSGRRWHSVFNRRPNGGYYEVNGVHGFCFSCDFAQIDSQTIFPPTWWHNVPQDTTMNGVAYFTGRDSSWVQDTIIIPMGCIVRKTDQANLTRLMFRFSVFSDSNATTTNGWMIDDIKFTSNPFYCIGGINDINSSHLTISPNPVESGFSISLTDQLDNNYTVTLLDLTGREMMTKDFTGREVALHRDGLVAGSYIVKVTNVRTEDSFEKRVVFE